MARVTRAQIAWAFRAAVHHLARNEQEVKQGNKSAFICFAIGDGCENIAAPTLPAAADEACRIIDERLDRYSTIRMWLVGQGVEQSEMTLDRLQTHRHKWLQQLIAEFEAPVSRKGK